MNKFSLFITVYRQHEHFCAAYTRDASKILTSDQFQIFTMFEDGDNLSMVERLNVKARARARQQKILKVHGLD